MGQIVGLKAKPKRANLNALSLVPTPAAGEYILVSSDNSMQSDGQGNFDKYVVGDGSTAAESLTLNNITDIGEFFTAHTRTYTESDATISGYIIKQDGTLTSYSGWYTSPKISIIGAYRIVASGLYYANTYTGFAIYDSSDNLLLRNSATSIDITNIPSTAAYIRFSRKTQTPFISVYFGAEVSDYLSNSVAQDDFLPISSDAVYNDVLCKIESTSTTYSGTQSGYILKADGTTTSFSGYTTSDFISVDSECTMTASGLYANSSSYAGLCFYDETFTMTSDQPETGISTTSVDFADYPDVAYIRFSGNSSPTVTISRGYDMKGIVEDMSVSVDELTPLFDITANSFGIISTDSRTTALSATYAIATSANCAASGNGIINKVYINVNAAGNVHLGIGLLDQSMIPVILREFDITCPNAGYNEVDVQNKKLTIYQDEQIFFMYRSQDGVRIKYSVSTDSSDAEYTCPYGEADSSLGYYSQGYVIFTLGYTMNEVDSVFALESELEELQSTISTLTSSSYVYDEDGTPYKLRIRNGEIVASPQVFSKVLILGNSLTWMEYKDNIGWYGTNRPMASTTADVSWPYLLERILQQRQASASVTGVMMRNWETAGDGSRDITSISSTKALLDAALTSDTDLIIFRCGENGTVSDSDTYKQEILDLIDYCLDTATTASVVMCGLFWPNTTKDTAILAAANARGYTYVTAGRGFSGYKELKGDYMVDDTDGTEKRIGSNCLTHTADHGFYLWANYLASSIGYSSYVLNELHTISITSSLTNGYKIKDTESPYLSLVTILVSEETQPTISVTDGDGNAVTTSVYTISDLDDYTFAFTFIQPNSDVEVTLS